MPLLLAARFTDRGQDLALHYPQALKALRILAFLAVVRRVNAWLNRRAVNNGVADRYDWAREIVVLTGGSNGIGRQIALKLARRGVTVAVLDIQPPADAAPEDGRKIHYHECNITSSAAVALSSTIS